MNLDLICNIVVALIIFHIMVFFSNVIAYYLYMRFRPTNPNTLDTKKPQEEAIVVTRHSVH